MDDVLEGKHDLKQALKGIPQAEPVVLLVHEPDYADYVKDVDLQLSGHSHGGQIRFPLSELLCLPVMGRKYPQGLRRIGPLTLYTNVGIGTIWVPMRLNCPPEVTLITLRARLLKTRVERSVVQSSGSVPMNVVALDLPHRALPLLLQFAVFRTAIWGAFQMRFESFRH